ncbi:MAG: type II toxin-antitoxin system VapC family toxin [Proteobacteria bacterium]|nr:type II toxin-antitoxin system VapC family toxin [Pseudomonadota bacterium]
MSYLVDTNAISELVHARPDKRVAEWFDRAAPESLHVSVLTLGELRKGVETLPAGARKERIEAWLAAELPAWFEDRVLPIDAAVADAWGRLLAHSARPVAAVDSLIAATALTHRLRVVTRNVADFRFPGPGVVNPWEAGD